MEYRSKASAKLRAHARAACFAVWRCIGVPRTRENRKRDVAANSSTKTQKGTTKKRLSPATTSYSTVVQPNLIRTGPASPPTKKNAKELFAGEQAGDGTAEDDVVVPAVAKTRAHPSSNKRVAKGLSAEEQGGESVADSGGSEPTAAEDSPSTAA